MENRTSNNLKSSEKKPLKQFIRIGDKIVCILDKDIIKKLKIRENSTCEQSLTEEGDIVLRIIKFLEGE